MEVLTGGSCIGDGDASRSESGTGGEHRNGKYKGGGVKRRGVAGVAEGG